MTGLTPKQQRFVEEYLIDLNATQAAIRAGYSESTARAIASENLTKPDICEAIASLRAAIAAKYHATPERIIAELSRLSFSNMRDYMEVGDDGQPRLNWAKLNRDQAAALIEVTVEEFTEGKGEDARPVRRVKFKLADKRGALVDLGKFIGLDKVPVAPPAMPVPDEPAEASPVLSAKVLAFRQRRAG